MGGRVNGYDICKHMLIHYEADREMGSLMMK